MTRRLMPYTQSEIDEQLSTMIPRESYDTEDARTPEQALAAEIAHHESGEARRLIAEVHAAHVAHTGEQAMSMVVAVMLDALGEALTEDLESGAHWMNEAASAEFKKKYPRFTTLFGIARNVNWAEVLILQK